MCGYEWVRFLLHMQANTCTDIHAYIHMHACTRTLTYTYVHMHVGMHTVHQAYDAHTHTHTHTYTYTHKCNLLRLYHCNHTLACECSLCRRLLIHILSSTIATVNACNLNSPMSICKQTQVTERVQGNFKGLSLHCIQSFCGCCPTLSCTALNTSTR
jgi:hypothetical protein